MVPLDSVLLSSGRLCVGRHSDHTSAGGPDLVPPDWGPGQAPAAKPDWSHKGDDSGPESATVRELLADGCRPPGSGPATGSVPKGPESAS